MCPRRGWSGNRRAGRPVHGMIGVLFAGVFDGVAAGERFAQQPGDISRNLGAVRIASKQRGIDADAPTGGRNGGLGEYGGDGQVAAQKAIGAGDEAFAGAEEVGRRRGAGEGDLDGGLDGAGEFGDLSRVGVGEFLELVEGRVTRGVGVGELEKERGGAVECGGGIFKIRLVRREALLPDGVGNNHPCERGGGRAGERGGRAPAWGRGLGAEAREEIGDRVRSEGRHRMSVCAGVR